MFKAEQILGIVKDHRFRLLLYVLLVGLIIRFILMPITSSPFDVGEGWVAIIDSYYAGDDLYQSGWYLYPPMWGYVLSVMGDLLQLLGMNSFGDVFPVYLDRFNCFGYNYVTNLLFNFMIKLPILAFDLLAGWAIYKLAYKLTSDIKKSTVCFALWFLSPISIVSGACLAMFDSLIVFLIVLAILAFLDRRYFETGLLIGFGVVTKFFSLFLTPVMVAYVLSDSTCSFKKRLIVLGEAVIGFFIAVFFVYAPVIATGEFSDSLSFITMRTDAASSGFSHEPTFNNISYYLPLIGLEYLVMFFVMLLKKMDREKTLLWLLMFSMVPMFALPYVSYTPTYGVVLVPSVVILYCLKGKIAIIPWLSLLVFPIHGILHYWGQMFYSLGAFTDLVDLASIPMTSGNAFAYNIVLYYMCLSGFSFFCVLVYYIIKPWIGRCIQCRSVKI